jgi:DeoR/GlpR family transcriptional regulator of sugar metabolism
VKVVFNFSPEILEQNTDEMNILNLLSMRDEITIGELMQYLKISRNTATRKLNKLINLGKLIRKGKGPTVKYLLK